jgi:hypothetical protein
MHKYCLAENTTPQKELEIKLSHNNKSNNRTKQSSKPKLI